MSNRRTHGVRFADAVAAFSDHRAITIEDEHPEEERLVTIGRDGLGRLLIIVRARGDRIRIMSARKATAREQRGHEGPK